MISNLTEYGYIYWVENIIMRISGYLNMDTLGRQYYIEDTDTLGGEYGYLNMYTLGGE